MLPWLLSLVVHFANNTSLQKYIYLQNFFSSTLFIYQKHIGKRHLFYISCWKCGWYIFQIPRNSCVCDLLQTLKVSHNALLSARNVTVSIRQVLNRTDNILLPLNFQSRYLEIFSRRRAFFFLFPRRIFDGETIRIRIFSSLTINVW